MIINMDVNLLAVLVLTLLAMFLGYLWYSPALFGNRWMRLVDMDENDIKEGSNYAMFVSLVLTFLMTYVLAVFIGNIAGVNSFWEGAQVGLFAWLGFVLTTGFINGVYENKSKKLLTLTLSHHFLVLLVLGGLLAIWQ